VIHFAMTGHVHVYREVYEPHSAARGITILDLAKRITQQTAEPIVSTVADRAQPGNIALLADQGLHCEPYSHPGRPSVRGQIVDGIDRVLALLNATVPLRYPADPKTWQEQVLDRHGGDVPPGGSVELLVELSRYKRSTASRDPLF
jgi:hypothetical protein